MKKCMICGWDESDNSKFTCPACGEATWSQVMPLEALNGPETLTVEVVEPKRGLGRPKKVAQ